MATAAAVKLSAAARKGLSDEVAASIVTLLTAIRDGNVTDEAMLVIGEHYADWADKIEAALKAEADAKKQAEKAEAAAKKAAGESRLPAAPKKKSGSDEDDSNKPVKLVEGRHYVAPSIPRLKGLVLEFTGKFVGENAAKNAGEAKLRVLSDGDLKGKLVPVPATDLRATTKKVAASKVAKKTEVTEEVPSEAMGLLLPPFATQTLIVR